jgi:hypothetical protein
MCLSRRVLALTRCQHLAEDRFFNFGLVDAGAGHHGLYHGRAQIMRRGGGESAVEAADGSPACGHDYDIGHLSFLPLRPCFARRPKEACAALILP